MSFMIKGKKMGRVKKLVAFLLVFGLMAGELTGILPLEEPETVKAELQLAGSGNYMRLWVNPNDHFGTDIQGDFTFE